jgi:hypothetical protein
MQFFLAQVEQGKEIILALLNSLRVLGKRVRFIINAFISFSNAAE